MTESPDLPPAISANASEWIRVAMKIRCIRGARGLAEETGMTPCDVEDRLAGRRRWTADELAHVARHLGMPFWCFAEDRARYQVGTVGGPE